MCATANITSTANSLHEPKSSTVCKQDERARYGTYEDQEKREIKGVRKGQTRPLQKAKPISIHFDQENSNCCKLCEWNDPVSGERRRSELDETSLNFPHLSTALRKPTLSPYALGESDRKNQSVRGHRIRANSETITWGADARRSWHLPLSPFCSCASSLSR